jgi:Uncharacterized conserved protein (DUF2285)
VLPAILRIGNASSGLVGRRYDLDLGKLSDARLRQSLDGWHAVMQLGGVTHRLWLQELPPKGGPIAVELPLNADFDLQSLAARRLWAALGKRSLRGLQQSLPFQQRQRLILAIRALDGRLEGNSYRAIAAGLFGENRISERGWKTHDLRNRTRRLVETGEFLMRGGYRALLRHRRKGQ